MAFGDPFHKPTRGELFRPDADQFSMLIEDAQQRRQQGQSANSRLGGGLPIHIAPWVKNTTSGIVPFGGVLKITGSIIAPDQNPHGFRGLVLKGEAVTSSSNRVVVTLEPIGVNQIGRCIIAGAVAVRITDVGNVSAAPIPGSQANMRCGTGGFPLLAREDGTGDRWGIILLGAASNCTQKYQLWVYWNPSGGSFPLPVRVRDEDDEWVSETVTIPYNATTTETRVAIEGHSLLGADTVIVTGATRLNSGPHTVIMPEGSELGTGGTESLDSTDLIRSGLEDPQAYLSECCS